MVEYLLRNNEQSRYSLLGTNIPNWLYSAYNNLLWFLFGAACSQLTTDVGKYTIGRLRPHFLQICKPNIVCDLNNIAYIEDFKCTGDKEEKFTDSRLSFPSGHSSLSFYCMIYLAVSVWFFFLIIILLLLFLYIYFCVSYICKPGLRHLSMQWQKVYFSFWLFQWQHIVLYHVSVTINTTGVMY